MSLKPPPLQWLPAFEAAARLVSFRRAAEELHITTSAVSQQVRQLEAYLAQALFLRQNRTVRLTETGRAYAALASQVLQSYRQGHERLMQRAARPALRITMTPLVAHELVLPALADFQSHQPDIDLHIESSMEVADFASLSVDAAIRYGSGVWPGLESLPLSRCSASLVAAPSLLARQPIQQLSDLAAHTLIHQRADRSDWASAAAELGLNEVPSKGDLMLDSNLAALRAAEQGLGIAIGVWPLVQPWLDDGRLVAILPPRPLSTGDHLVFRRDDPRREYLLTVYDWLKGRFDQLAPSEGALSSSPPPPPPENAQA